MPPAHGLPATVRLFSTGKPVKGSMSFTSAMALFPTSIIAKLSKLATAALTEAMLLPFSRNSVREGNFSRPGNAFNLLWPTESFFKHLKPRKLQSSIELCDSTRVSSAGLFFRLRPSISLIWFRAAIRAFKLINPVKPDKFSTRLSLMSSTANEDKLSRCDKLRRQLLATASQQSVWFFCKKLKDDNLLLLNSSFFRFSNDFKDATDEASRSFRSSSVAVEASPLVIAFNASESFNLIPPSTCPSSSARCPSSSWPMAKASLATCDWVTNAGGAMHPDTMRK
mmetsp:Transcript_128902/g.321522  ORF Transcript_128902/g.321522 Transcript_128902/m.321522 type:complete len:282 (-) Transcript_128902:18-863(-)